jgi:SAM-dependent methyltransferase
MIVHMGSNQTNRAVNTQELKDLFEQDTPNVSTELSPDDDMFEGHTNHYFQVGHSAMRGVKLAMLAAGKGTLTNILDFGSGHGRVLRTFRAAFPNARLTACDVIPDAVEYCARTFGAVPIVSRQHPREVPLEGEYDLIWCGTMFTNLNEQTTLEFLSLFYDHLAPDGLLVFTTHGRYVAGRLRAGETTYGLDPAVIPGLLADYDGKGYGFREYPPEVIREHFSIDMGSYGIAVQSPAWVFQQLTRFPDTRLLTFTERGWDNHQDMVSCLRVKPPTPVGLAKFRVYTPNR